jgi:hypothetical protein
MAISQDVVVLNDFGSMRVEERQRTTGAGTSSRYTVTMTADPILHDFAQAKLSRTVPDALAALLRRQIEAITAPAAPSTIKSREYAANAFERGESWARKKYGGGRIGDMKPNGAPTGTGKLFNDSGRFAKSVVAMQNIEEGTFTINVAANRLRPESFPAGAYDRMIERLRQLAPAWKGGINALQDPALVDAIKTAQAEWIVSTAKAGVKANSAAWALIKKYGWQYGVRPVMLG